MVTTGDTGGSFFGGTGSTRWFWLHLLLALLLVVAVVCVFGPSLGNSFVTWDDQWYVVENEHLTITAPEDILWFFTHSYYWSYIPLTLLSHALDYALWGHDPFGHHLTSLAAPCRQYALDVRAGIERCCASYRREVSTRR